MLFAAVGGITAWLSAAAAVFTFAGLLGGASVIFRNRLKDELIATQEKRIDALKEEMEERDERCKSDVAELRGQVQALTGSFAADLGRAIVQEVSDNLHVTPRRTTRGQ